MLDTNIVSHVMRERSEPVIRRLRALQPGDVCISAITLAELRYGADHSVAAERYHSLIDAFVRRVQPVPFDRRAADAYGGVRAELARRGTPIGPLDTLIAGHALSIGAVLVTHNASEFARVPDLAVEDWTVPAA